MGGGGKAVSCCNVSFCRAGESFSNINIKRHAHQIVKTNLLGNMTHTDCCEERKSKSNKKLIRTKVCLVFIILNGHNNHVFANIFMVYFLCSLRVFFCNRLKTVVMSQRAEFHYVAQLNVCHHRDNNDVDGCFMVVVVVVFTCKLLTRFFRFPLTSL